MKFALVRCDATSSIGGGHVGRCLAIAEELAEAGWRVEFSVGPEATKVFPRLAASNFGIHTFKAGAVADTNNLEACLSAGKRADLIIVDHYEIDWSFERACRRFSDRILVFDDATGRLHDCDWLLDAAAESDQPYAGRVPSGAEILYGIRFALVRQEFVKARSTALSRRDGRPVRNILISFGATDPWNASSAVLRALSGTISCAATIVLSSQGRHIDEVQRHCAEMGHRLVVDPTEMAPLLIEADLAIGAPGSAAYERAALGVPSVMVLLAENQRGIAAAISASGAAVLAGELDANLPARLIRIVSDLCIDARKRVEMAHAAASLIDGRAAARVMDVIR